MGKRGQAISQSQWESYDKQLRALHKDWHYLYKLIEGYAQSRFDARDLEVAYLDLKGRISCDYPLLNIWRSQSHGIHGEIGTFFDHGTTLKSLAEGWANGTGRTLDEWQLVDEALGYARQLLQTAQEKTKTGKPVRLPEEFFKPHASEQDIDRYAKRFNAFRADWRRLYEIVQLSLRPGADRGALETEFLNVRARLSYDYPTLPRWFGGRDEIAKGVDRILSSGTSLEALAKGIHRGGLFGRDWGAVESTVGTVCAELNRAREQSGNGRDHAIVEDFFSPPGRKRIPLKKLLTRLASVVAVLLAVAMVYFMRTYLGFWAPEAGEGIEVTASLEDEEKVNVVLTVMTQACRTGSVDTFMTAIAPDFEDDEGNGRRALRVVVQAYNAAGRMEHAWFDWKRSRLTRKEEWLYATPVLIRSELEEEETITLRVGFKQYDERWLVAYAEGHN